MSFISDLFSIPHQISGDPTVVIRSSEIDFIPVISIPVNHISGSFTLCSVRNSEEYFRVETRRPTAICICISGMIVQKSSRFFRFVKFILLIFVCEGEKEVGIALFFHNFSTFRAISVFPGSQPIRHRNSRVDGGPVCCCERNQRSRPDPGAVSRNACRRKYSSRRSQNDGQ